MELTSVRFDTYLLSYVIFNYISLHLLYHGVHLLFYTICILFLFIWLSRRPIISKFDQYFTVLWQMSLLLDNAMGCQPTTWGFFIPFLALNNRDIRRVGFFQGGLSSLRPEVTSTFVIFPYFLMMFNYTFVNMFWNVHTLKHIIFLLKNQGPKIKDL